MRQWIARFRKKCAVSHKEVGCISLLGRDLPSFKISRNSHCQRHGTRLQRPGVWSAVTNPSLLRVWLWKTIDSPESYGAEFKLKAHALWKHSLEEGAEGQNC